MRETPENTGDDLETTEDCCLYTIDHFRKRLLCEKGGGGLMRQLILIQASLNWGETFHNCSGLPVYYVI